MGCCADGGYCSECASLQEFAEFGNAKSLNQLNSPIPSLGTIKINELRAKSCTNDVLQAVARQYRLISALYRSLPFVPCNTRATRAGFFVRQMFRGWLSRLAGAAFCPAEPSAAIVRESPLQSDDGFVQTSKQVNRPFRITATKGSNRLAGMWRCSPPDLAFGITQPPNAKRFASINRDMLAEGEPAFLDASTIAIEEELYDE